MELNTIENEDLILSDDLFAPEVEEKEEDKWHVLLVDDDPEVHSVSRMALRDFTFRFKGLEMHSCFSGEEARVFLSARNDIAVILCDVVMETDDAGLRLVKFIREDLKNTHVRIILRTGQPGMAPESEVVNNYDIDDYKGKTELTVQKLHTSMVSSLRAYTEIMRIESIVQERTAELALKSAELEKQNVVIRQKNDDLMDSIYYARRIQEAILPQRQLIEHFLPDSFVFFKPKAVISGDFYWFYARKNYVMAAAVDCTGHGVPGALMSVMGTNFLNQIVIEARSLEPAEILAELDRRIRRTLNSERESKRPQDGMDMAMVRIDTETREVCFSGAMRPLYVFTKAEGFKELKGTRASIGGMDVSLFEQQVFTLEPNETMYMFSDGYTDQFGGENGRKFTPKKFQELLESMLSHTMPAQEQKLFSELTAWKGRYDQTDDILVIGIRL